MTNLEQVKNFIACNLAIGRKGVHAGGKFWGWAGEGWDDELAERALAEGQTAKGWCVWCCNDWKDTYKSRLFIKK